MDNDTDEKTLRIGIDIGGTFTDIVTVSNGTIRVTKTPSTPHAPENGVMDGLQKARTQEEFSFDSVSFLGHGTTVATNAILEETWADTALVTTIGFRDVLEIGRQARPDIYDFQAEKPTPIIERDRRFEITERLDERGNVLQDLDEEGIEKVAQQIDAEDVESVAICLLYSFENDTHERQVCNRLKEAGIDASWSLSSTVLPEIREYERTLVTAMNAALKPVMDRYIGNLGVEIDDAGITADLKIMQSNGGIIAAAVAREQPVNTLLSGPAAGVQGAAAIAKQRGFADVITMDMGGTSCDVSLVKDGNPLVTTDVEVGDYPVSIPMIDIHTIGAGGGSIAWLDAGGALRVGPRSAGADPGPICYGRGGTKPTITDAQLLLGRLNPDQFLSGELDVQTEDVRKIVKQKLAEPLEQSIEEVAQGIIDVANANMQRALRVVSVERGHDPREFGLVAFGGAGPLHACEIARDLDIPRVIIPHTAGVLSALGLLMSDVLYDYSTSRVRRFSELDPAVLQETFEAFEEQGQNRLAKENFVGEEMHFERTVDLRYLGQSFELSVPVDTGTLSSESIKTVTKRFHERHRQRYGHAYTKEPIELVTIRLQARGQVPPPELGVESPEGTVEDAVTETRDVIYDGESHEAWIYNRSQLPTGSEFDGPAVVQGPESTAVILPSQHVQVDELGNLLVETQSGGE